MVVCDQFVSFAGYHFEKYLIPMFKLGFRYCPHADFYPANESCDLMAENCKQILTKIKLKAIDNQLHTNYFVKELSYNTINQVDNEVARFHLFYQVIEMLMENAFKVEVQQEVCAKLQTMSGHETKDLFRDLMRDNYTVSYTHLDVYKRQIAN